MDRVGMRGVHSSEIELDICFACHVIWFDKRESIHLAARGTLDLFRVMSDHGDDPRHALASDARCPRCRARLSLFNDLGKGGRFQYYSCPARHGRLTPFSEFLKEKQFVRALNPAERHQLRAEVRQVQCSGCGAPVDVSRSFACEHCGAPITVLDPDAVEKTLRALERSDATRTGDPADREARARALAALEEMRSGPYERVGVTRPGFSSGTGLAADLLTVGLRAIFGRF
jgi:Zn-finger nucleic acid-binding protein